MYLTLPLNPSFKKLSAQYWFSSIRRGESEANKKVIQNRLEQVSVGVSVEIGSVDMTFSEIIAIRKDDVIKLTNTTVRDEFTLKVGARSKFKCRPGRVGSHIAVQIGENIEEIPDEFLVTTRSREDQ